MHRNTNNGKGAHGRLCASCRLCCIHLEIESKPGQSTRFDTGEDLAKEAHEPCRYLTAYGCSIYEQRPLICRQFACDWLIGSRDFPESKSPLLSGIIGVRGSQLHLDREKWLNFQP